MKFLKNTIGFLSVFCMVPAVFGVTVRPGAIGAGNAVMGVSATGAARRMPTATYKGTSSSAVVSASNLLDNIECIDAYMECIENDDTCGVDFSECTTNVLFHAQMPDCISTLAQCSPDGINSLFGTSSTTALSGVAEYNDDNEIVRYTYPTDGSVMGQKIIAARIENMYDDQTCVKRYTNCLKRDDVCGENFELCSSTRSFKKQALNCDSHLARCAMSGVRKMFGDNVKSKAMGGLLNDKNGVALTIDQLSSVGGSIATLIDEGSDYVAANAVSSCYKKVDACIASACKKNPLRCIEGTSIAAVQAAQGVSDGALGSDLADSGDTLTASEINRYLRTTCADEIGGLDACHITYFGKKPKASDLANPEIMDEVFVMAHNDRKSSLESKIQGFLQEFDREAKNKCQETVMQCVMRTCGGGSGAACYSKVFSTAGENTINGAETYNEIERGCASVANTDPNCLYAYRDVAGDEYSYMYATEDAFTTLFPKKTSGSGDPIGLVAALNSSLALNYNEAAIAQMRKDCESVATSCVRSLCGEDYVSCYRNRTDIASALTKTDNTAFDKSMNKVGGVLDYTIVLGLCGETVKNAASCEEHLAIERAKLSANQNATAGWGTAETVGQGWYNSGNSKTTFAVSGINVADKLQAKDANGKLLCSASNGEQGECQTFAGRGLVFDEPVMMSRIEVERQEATTSLFRELLITLEREAQAIYNAKLTEQQNACLASNDGGIMGTDDTGSTYMWAKLSTSGGEVPADYSSQGLKAGQFKASNELYGSFCRLKVTVHSDDANIMNALNGQLAIKEITHKLGSHEKSGVDYSGVTGINREWATRYFAVGDTFVCGSWIPQEDLMRIADAVGATARANAEAKQTNLRGWMAALGALGLGTGGAFLGDAIQDGTAFPGLMDKPKTKKSTYDDDASSCQKKVTSAQGKIRQNINAKTVAAATTEAAAMAEEYAYDANKLLSDAYELLSKWEVSYTDADSAVQTALGEYYDSNNMNCTEGKTDCVASKSANAKTKMQEVYNLCNKIKENGKKQSRAGTGKDWFKRDGGTLLGAVGGAVVGGGLAWGITNEIQNAQLDKAEQEAIQEFMDNVGSKIQCYVGPQMVGTYGQAIPTSME